MLPRILHTIQVNQADLSYRYDITFLFKIYSGLLPVDLWLESDCDKKEMTKKSIFYVDDS